MRPIAICTVVMTACLTASLYAEEPQHDAPADRTSTPSPVEQPIELKTATGTLFGTLDLPQGDGPWPVAVILAGSGPTDRDGNQTGMKNDSLKMLGQALAAHGIAALRYDKRGIAKSAAACPKEEDLRLDTYVADVVSWIQQLRQDPRFTKVAIIGHSEGSLIGMLAAKQADVQAFVSLEGAGRTAPDLLREQLKPKLPADLYQKTDHILDELSAGRTVTDTPVELAALFRPSVQPYLISWFKHDPAKDIAELKMPVLIVQGTTDAQVSVDDAKRLAAANKGSHLVTIPDMNHVLKHTSLSGVLAQLNTYVDPSLPLAPDLVEAVTSFLGDSFSNRQK